MQIYIPVMKKSAYSLVFLFICIFINLTCTTEKTGEKLSERIVYTGDSLRHILFPVGGIGTGNILLGGRGEIHEIEIFGKPSLDELRPYMTFFCIRAKPNNQKPVFRISERELHNNFPNPFGVPRQQLAGMPRFREAQFSGTYPFAHISFIDKKFPLKVSLEAFNPLIPLDVDNSSLPVAVFYWNIKNEQPHAVDVSLCFNMANMLNPADVSGSRTLGGTTNKYVESGNIKGIFMDCDLDTMSGNYGNMAMFTTWPETDFQTHWYRGNWWDNAHVFYDDFMSDGRLDVVDDTSASHEGLADVASLLVHLELSPGEERKIPFYLAWYVPHRKPEASMALGHDEALNSNIRNYYSNQFRHAVDVAEYVVRNEDYLYQTSRKYVNLIEKSTFPEYVKDAATANAAGLKTNLLLRDSFGNVHAFEGLGNNFGCCPGNCTHVWNYAQTMASLFPSLEQNVREIAFMHDTHENGYQNFRTPFPIGNYYFRNVAADGQMGNIVRVYREWKLSGDTEWLKKLWPKVKLALEFAWKGAGEYADEYPWTAQYKIPWDPGKEGVLRGDQHNTYDINFFGPNMMTGSCYLAAIKACAEMADYLGEQEKAAEYREIYESGKKKYQDLLWNGEYYEQKIEVIDGVEIPKRLQSPPDENGDVLPKYQYGRGCLSDQLLGQYIAHVSGLGYILPEKYVKQAMKSVFSYNFIRQFREYTNVQRVYALNGESGLVACTWPKGDRPLLPFVYANETWTGIEYQAAASMIYSGLTDEGLAVTKAVRERYRGYNRNPWGEIESGRYYARAMASWSVMPALSGFYYDGVEHTMGFNPQIKKNDFFTFWSCGSGWGSFRKNHESMKLKVEYGSLIIRKFLLPKSGKNVNRITLNNNEIEFSPEFKKSVELGKIVMYTGDDLIFFF